jgi:DNA mismatch repair protein MutL
MADIIQLLPDSIANQIAAGEVIQRPASVVKELMENAIDAGATQIRLVLRDAGKSLIQVMDNGSGMSETDARMCFERHATSKIRYAKDLFAIRTMGFRGEALASIAAVAQVELRSRLSSQEVGTRLVVEGSRVRVQEPCQCPQGSVFTVRNLFFNVPARRNFLKSDPVEMRHILDEFQHLAIANPEVFFSLHHNDNEVFHLPASNLRQRVVGIFGSQSNKKLVPVNEETDIVRIAGFVGKPEFARKTRGEQMFFVNSRFIKSGYLHHAVMSAFEDLVTAEAFPMYILFIDIDPARIDINVHPTKQEIKFDDERLVYNYLRVAVRHALGQHAVMPTLDFEAEPAFTPYRTVANSANRERDWRIEPSGQQGNRSDAFTKNPSTQGPPSSSLKNWRMLFEGLQDTSEESSGEEESGQQAITIESAVTGAEPSLADASASTSQKSPYQVHNSYIVSQIKSGFLFIDQQSAHERILYERYIALFDRSQASTQKELFPRMLKLGPADAALLREILPDINALGFDLAEFRMDTFVVHGIPAEVFAGQDAQKTIELLLEQYKGNLELRLDSRENLARSLARSASIKKGKPLSIQEMQELIDKLFACEMPYKSPSGHSCFITFDLETLRKDFENS